MLCYDTIVCYMLRYSSVLYATVQQCAMCYGTIVCYMLRYNSVLCATIVCYVLRYKSVLYATIMYGDVMHRIVLRHHDPIRNGPLPIDRVAFVSRQNFLIDGKCQVSRPTSIGFVLVVTFARYYSVWPEQTTFLYMRRGS